MNSNWESCSDVWEGRVCTQACDLCRQRKRKCDNQRHCGACSKRGAFGAQCLGRRRPFALPEETIAKGQTNQTGGDARSCLHANANGERHQYASTSRFRRAVEISSQVKVTVLPVSVTGLTSGDPVAELRRPAATDKLRCRDRGHSRSAGPKPGHQAFPDDDEGGQEDEVEHQRGH